MISPFAIGFLRFSSCRQRPSISSEQGTSISLTKMLRKVVASIMSGVYHIAAVFRASNASSPPSSLPGPLQSLSFRFRDQTKPIAPSPSPRAREADWPLSPAQRLGASQCKVYIPADPPSLEPPRYLPPFWPSLLVFEHDWRSCYALA